MTDTGPGDQSDGRAPSGTVLWREPAKAWTGVLVLLAGLVVLCVLDELLLGGISIVGWALIILGLDGVYALLIYSARSTKSLALTEDELWVGDEVLPRESIVGVTRGVPSRREDDLPVLGWPTGLPRLARGLTLLLADDRAVVVPVRDVDTLADRLGVQRTAARSLAGIRPAGDDDLDTIREIDERAETVFRVAGHTLPDLDFDVDAFGRAAAVFVAGDPATGFVWLDEVDGLAYVHEISVVPRAMRQGIGTALLEHACTWAREAGYPSVVLTTYRDVPWNGPFYTRNGFAELPDVPPGLAAIRAREAESGLDAVGVRVVMTRPL